MRKIMALFIIAALCMGILPQQISSAQMNTDSVWEPEDVTKTEPKGAEENDSQVEVDFISADGYGQAVYREEIGFNGWYVSCKCRNLTNEPSTLHISSSNPNVIQITSNEEEILTGNEESYKTIRGTVVGAGITDIIVSAEGMSYIHRVYAVPEEVHINRIYQSGYQSITLEWQKVQGCSGYQIERAQKGSNDFQSVFVADAEAASAVVKAEWNRTYTYRVVGFVEDDIRRIEGNGPYNKSGTDFTAEKIGTEITSIQKTGGSSLKIQWNAMAGALGYKLYRSTMENDGYQCIYTANGGHITSYTQKVSKGVTYYYKLTCIFPEGESEFSSSVGRFIPKKGKVKKVSASRLGQQVSYGGGQYSGNWANADQTYYYQADGKLSVVCVQKNGNLKISKLNSALKIASTKTVKLKCDHWGGFYHGTDGKFYVAVGYDNLKESREKTVIKVIQYSKKWKKEKTAIIKGSAKNGFTGIYQPFSGGNCRMDMEGTTLYLMTARTMFAGSDGLHHQSNIAFRIDTKTMEAKESNISYCSHSFNQFVKFKDGTLHLLDHGDAYPRCLKLTMAPDYSQETTNIVSSNLFSLQGATGQNFTGCKVGGMEVGGKNVLICGTSQPHGAKIKGVSGYGLGIKYNAYVILADRQTGKPTLKWLTKYNPKSNSVEVGEARMVKLSDDRFAIMYSVTKKGKKKLHYTVLSDTGKKIYSKTYSNVVFDGTSQPILFKGNIIWAETKYSADYRSVNTQIYRIPAVY